jgi:hypothetical protein
MDSERQTIPCIWCSQKSAEFVSDAVIAPWAIGVESLASPELDTRLVHCSNCDIQFFARRYSSSELQFLYSDYRGEQYLKRRRRWEPWYSSKRNHLIGHDHEVIPVKIPEQRLCAPDC